MTALRTETQNGGSVRPAQLMLLGSSVEGLHLLLPGLSASSCKAWDRQAAHVFCCFDLQIQSFVSRMFELFFPISFFCQISSDHAYVLYVSFIFLHHSVLDSSAFSPTILTSLTLISESLLFPAVPLFSSAVILFLIISSLQLIFFILFN